MITQPELASLKKNDPVEHFLIIRRIEVRNTRAGSDYLSLELGDRSGSLNCNVWENFKDIARSGSVGDIVSVTGTVEEFQGALQIRVASIRFARDSDKVLPDDFLPRSLKDPEVMVSEFKSRIESISDIFLKKLLEKIFSGERLKNFSRAPAGKSWHHAYLHGLIEHTLEIIKICDLMCDFHPELNRDLLIAGAMLHDLGKIDELKYDSAFEYTDEGKLIGHIVIAAVLIKEEIWHIRLSKEKNISGFPEELEKNLIHLILSHQGKLEHASPVVPKTIEAIALYQADELSAKVNAYKNAVTSEIKGESNWTKFIQLAQTDLYKHNLYSGSGEKSNNSLFD